jgi:hypothetical protein
VFGEGEMFLKGLVPPLRKLLLLMFKIKRCPPTREKLREGAVPEEIANNALISDSLNVIIMV